MSISLLSNQLHAALLGGSKGGASQTASTEMGEGFKDALAAGSSDKGLGAMVDGIRSNVLSVMNDGRRIESSLDGAIMGQDGMEQVIQDVAEYSVKVEAFKNILDTAISSTKKVVLEMQL